MANARATNFFLLVIAICLVLIVVKLYDVDLVTQAHAQQEQEPTTVGCMGWFEGIGANKTAAGWRPIRVDQYGDLKVTK